MMPALNNDQVATAVGGMQKAICITAITSVVTAAQREALIGANLAGAVLPIGTFICDIDITGLRKLEVRLRLSAFFAAITPTLFSTLLDGVTQRKASTPAGAAFAAINAEQVLAFADGDLLGERILRLTIVTTAANNVFDRAEISGI